MDQKGFTLIELIMVIVILGILATAAMPKYVEMRTEARQSTVDGLAGAIAGASAIGHAACLIDTACVVTAASDTTTMGGVPVAIVYGYPAATVAGIQTAMDYTAGNFSTDITAAGSIFYHLTTTADTATPFSGCQVNYVAATSAAVPSSTTSIKDACNF